MVLENIFLWDVTVFILRSFCVATTKPLLCAAQRASPLHIQDPRRMAHIARYTGTGAPPHSNKSLVPKDQRRRASLRRERDEQLRASRTRRAQSSRTCRARSEGKRSYFTWGNIDELVV